MSKRIVICADGTWNRPEKDIKKDQPTNVLRFARSIRPMTSDGVGQQVFYDWGVGSYYDPVVGGATGVGVQKNIMDCYRYIVQNYEEGDELYFFGFSRGAYTVRALCGLINNCGILKREDSNLIQSAFNLYKRGGKTNKPNGINSLKFRTNHCHNSKFVKFVGVWDTVGAMGIPLSFLGLFEDKDEFYDNKIGTNVNIARHALAIDEKREDFEPTIWSPSSATDIKQTWFSGVHSDIGGGYMPDSQGLLASIPPMRWMACQAAESGLAFEPHWISNSQSVGIPKLNKSRRTFYRLKKEYLRPIDHGLGEVLIHKSVKERWDNDLTYRPKNLAAYIKEKGWPIHFE
ncbi:DUF2235 domain-containing protein [Vibrio parahaemolyticus]|uniref:DUF2235 domain-containing protein n=1 Tax=Vibrio harveyi group TaxID=717610 RepID=UPI00215BB787|nr:DUF2235 domain-containing protein [Vibrio parahaemolyticus]MCR9643648.1 DUF2235 domain-containing protein [Vibrio parahaemolyticus]MCR9798120.1 DUF2235 domain-containing protein [Vibrio parahaemolyticus]MDF4314089.1 DUF2235 domain-containing protein [Vibrio parahaemolyticus]